MKWGLGFRGLEAPQLPGVAPGLLWEALGGQVLGCKLLRTQLFPLLVELGQHTSSLICDL